MNTIQRERRSNDRRKINKHKYFKLYWVLKSFMGIEKGTIHMCRMATICPKFERRSSDGVDGACKHCEYLKEERKKIKLLRILTGTVFLAFIVTTYLKFSC